MRHPVIPGDQLLLEATTVRVKTRTGHVRCKKCVGDKMAGEADIKFMLVDSEPLEEKDSAAQTCPRFRPMPL